MRKIPRSHLLTLAVLLCAASPAAAQETGIQETAQAPAQEEQTGTQATTGENPIVVVAGSQRGQVDAPQPPLLELGAEEIAAYGAGSITELIEALSPQVSSGRGRGGGGFPVILVNGTRISSFRELRSYPPEAIAKVEVFPEEVALRYGYSADQRVVNLILKPNYESREVEVEYGQPFDGGYSRKEVEATYLRIDGPSRLNLNLGWEDGSLLTEAERDIVQAPTSAPLEPGDPDPGAFRSLVSDTAELEATGNWTTQLSETGTTLSVNATYERDDSLRLQGLDSFALLNPAGERTLRVLTRNSRSSDYALGTALNASLGDWQVTATADGALGRNRTFIDRRTPSDDPAADPIIDQAQSDTYRFESLVTARGRPILLPAGEVSVTLNAGTVFNGIASTDTRNPGLETDLSRRRVSAGGNLSVPITSVRDDVWAAIGDLTLNASAGIDHLSDFGTLTDWTAGLTWDPTETLAFTANYIARDTAPSLSQLGDPEIATPNEQVFDLTTGETVLATIITGGNPSLPAQSQRDWKLGVTWELPFLDRSNVSFEYFNNHAEDIAAGLPLLTPTIEAAFPGRVTRDSEGRLVSVDARPVTFARQDSQRVQLGLNLSGPFGKSRPEEAEGAGGRGGERRGPPIAMTGQAAAPPAAAQGGAASRGPDPERFRALREQLCMRDPQGALLPMDLTAERLAELPEPIQQRLRGPDGQIDLARVAQLRDQFCAMQGPGVGGEAGEQGQGGGFAGFDPAQMAALRQRLCVREGEELAALELTPELIAAIPEVLRQRLTGPDGQIDPERFAQFRARMCSREMPGTPGGQAGARQGGRGGGGGLGFLPGRGGDGRGRWFANLNYGYEIKNEVLVAEGGPLLDLLSGEALSGGGQSRHSGSVRGGIFYRGFGTILSGRYSGTSRVLGSGLPGSTDLLFGDLVRFDIRFFADLGQQESLVEAVPFLDDTRLSFAIDNIFDERQRVTDASGEVPLRYQPFLIDPTGRFFEIEVRKLF